MYTLKSKFTNSMDFLKSVNKKATWFFKKQVILFFMLIASAKIPEREGSISPFSFYGKLLDY